MASNHPQHIVQKLWNYCYCVVLRDDGLSHGDYIELLAHKLFRNTVYWQSART